MAKWWNQDMAEASQQMYSDPTTAFQVATMPPAVLAPQEMTDKQKITSMVETAAEQARKEKSGFLGKVASALGIVNEVADMQMSKVPGWGVFKNSMEALWWPVDKLASGAYWLYSEAVSQPLTTAFLVTGRAQQTGDYGSLFDGETWSDEYGKAENISPGQAIMNRGLTSGQVMAERIKAGEELGVMDFVTGMGATGELNDDQKRDAERKLYDTEYWRNKQGWTYTAGTGAIDFTIAVGADPTYALVKGAGAGIKAAKNINVKAGQEAALANGERLNQTYDWMAGKGAAEIAAHPMWGKGRRKNPFAQQYGEVYANASRDEMPLLTRYAMGDNVAMEELATKSADLGQQIARLNESRIPIFSSALDEGTLAHFVTEEAAGRAGAAAPAGIGGTSSPYSRTGELLEPPFPRPTTPGPRQAGWDATYGHLAQKAAAQRGAAGAILKAKQGVVPGFFGGKAINADDIKVAETWRKGQLASYEAELAAKMTKNSMYATLLGENLGRSIDEITPGISNLFGTASTLYRLGPVGGNVAKMGDKAVAKYGAGRGNMPNYGGVVSRTLRNGFYAAPVRAVQTFGEKLPETMINHTADDAGNQVMAMLKQVRGLEPEARIGMVNEYLSAGDKVARSKVLDSINSAIVHHYGKAANLDPEIVALIDNVAQGGIKETMGKLTGMSPTSQRFSAVADDQGRMVDMIEDGEALIVAPMAKTQLAQGEALFPVRDFERFIDRHSGALQGFKQTGGSAQDFVSGTMDGLSKVWKAATLLRPAYAVRTVSEEAAAAAVKYGMLTSVMGLSKGGANFFRNRGQQAMAFVGKGSYTATTGKGSLSRIALDSDEAKLIAEKYPELEATKIKLNKAWPIVDARISKERSAIDDLEKQVAKLKAKGEDTSALQARMADHQDILDEHVIYAKEMLRVAEDSQGRRLGTGTFEYRGEEVGEAFSRVWDNPVARDQVTSAKAVDFLFARGESIDMNRFIKSGDWVVLGPDDVGHMDAWVGALNKQFQQDDLYRLVAQDESLKTARAWLKTPAGKQHLSELGPWARDPDELLKGMQATLDQYAPRATGLQAKIAAQQDITIQELRAALPESAFPTVHGEEIKAMTKAFSKQSAVAQMDKMIAEGYRLLGGTPSDLLVRHPVFNQAYQARMTTLIDQHKAYRASVGGDESITAAEMNKMYENATNMAKKDISQVVYDPHRTTATEALRFVFPFLSAHTDSLQRWAGLIGEKPQLLVGASKIYNAPVAANLTTDSNGNQVRQDGYATVENRTIDPVTGKVTVTKEDKFVPIEERVINLRLPWDTKNQNRILSKIPGYGAPIKIQAMNTILPGDPWFNPGTGPLVQVPASEISKAAPQVGDFLQWSKVLPYGPSDNMLQAFAPKYMRAAWEAYTQDDPNNEKYQQVWLDVYNRKVAEYANGGEPIDIKDVDKEASDFMKLLAIEAWISPAQSKQSPLTGTPYQFYVDQYRKLQESDPKNARALFQATYGADYAGFTTSLTKSIGVAPTIAAMATSEEYKDLIDQDPEMAAWIVGDVYNKGSFSSSVYRAQMEKTMGGKPMREKTTALEAIRDNDVSIGWGEYLKGKGKIDSALIAAGFRSYQDAGAERFAAIRDNWESQVGEKYPEWQKKKDVINTGLISQRISFFEKIVADGRLASDPMRLEMPTLAQYLGIRQQFKAELNRRGAKKLSFDVNGQPMGNNADLGYAWRTTQMGLVNSNTQFNDTFNRYLENDDLS